MKQYGPATSGQKVFMLACLGFITAAFGLHMITNLANGSGEWLMGLAGSLSAGIAFIYVARRKIKDGTD